MSHYEKNEPVPEGKDPKIWRMAEARVGFQRHAFTYLIINLMLWTIWFFTKKNIQTDGFPWPVWTTVFWGIGLAFHFSSAYLFHKSNHIEHEYEKLKKKKI